MHTSKREHDQAILLMPASSRQRALRPRLLCWTSREASCLPSRCALSSDCVPVWRPLRLRPEVAPLLRLDR